MSPNNIREQPSGEDGTEAFIVFLEKQFGSFGLNVTVSNSLILSLFLSILFIYVSHEDLVT